MSTKKQPGGLAAFKRRSGFRELLPAETPAMLRKIQAERQEQARLASDPSTWPLRIRMEHAAVEAARARIMP